MRRVGHIIEEIVEPSNMEASFRQVLRGRKRKRSRQGCYLLAHKPEVLKELTAQIASGTFRVKDYRERDIVEGGKLRRIQVIPMKDRIAVHAIMAVVDRHLRKRFIRTTSASIKKRGCTTFWRISVVICVRIRKVRVTATSSISRSSTKV